MNATRAEQEVSPEALAEGLLVLWRGLMKGSTQNLYGLLAELDLSLTQMKTLHRLAECGPGEPISVKALGEGLAMSLPNASRTVDNLVQRGLLERREDEHDRRIRRVALTAAGLEVVHRIDNARLQGLEAWSAALSPEQRRILLDALSVLPRDRQDAS